MKAKKGASSPIYLFWEKKPKKKKHCPLLAHSCKCQNMISVTHFETLYLGKKLSCQSIIRYPEKRHIHIYLLQRKSPTSLSAAIRASPAVCSVHELAKNKQIRIHAQLRYLHFCKPAHKTETWTANTWGSTNSKPLGPIRMMSQ
jgi:hypothetical protein